MKRSKAVAYSYGHQHAFEGIESRHELHTTLPMDDLISLFESEIRELVDYDSFEYEHSENAIHVFRGSPRLHKCRYRIHTATMDLGQITLTRKYPFDEEEMLVVERALGALSIHLNNALEFQMELPEEHVRDLCVEAQLANLD